MQLEHGTAQLSSPLEAALAADERIADPSRDRLPLGLAHEGLPVDTALFLLNLSAIDSNRF